MRSYGDYCSIVRTYSYVAYTRRRLYGLPCVPNAIRSPEGCVRHYMLPPQGLIGWAFRPQRGLPGANRPYGPCRAGAIKGAMAQS
jgi:hypothetical protein